MIIKTVAIGLKMKKCHIKIIFIDILSTFNLLTQTLSSINASYCLFLYR